MLARDPPKPKPSLWKPIAAFAREYEPPRYVIDGLVRSGSLYLITARTGHGKTACLISAALAVVTGRADILGRKVKQGRVAFAALEKPDDTRARFIVAAEYWGIDLDELGDSLVILDIRQKPEEMVADLTRHAHKDDPFGLAIIDTVAAAYDGDDFNNTKQFGDFIRRLRIFSSLPGSPAILAATHPVKNASADNLIPHGAGTALNECDGNLTLWTEGEITTMHWQGKLRGLDFEPVLFRTVYASSKNAPDRDGVPISLPVHVPTSDDFAAAREESIGRANLAVLRAICANPGATTRELEMASGVRGGSVSRAIRALAAGKFIRLGADNHWHPTPYGKREAGG